jgi:serine protease Do
MNPKEPVGIHLSDAFSRVAFSMQQITVRVAGSRGGQGSGTVWLPSGLIVTNAHVADSNTHEVEFADGRTAMAWVIARDTRVDLAALAVSFRSLPVAAIGSACALRAGEMVLALGNPLGDRGALATGIVHRRVSDSPWLFADIRLAPGNSGGPLADASGAVVGINSMIIDGLGCAITSETVCGFLKRFRLAEAA